MRRSVLLDDAGIGEERAKHVAESADRAASAEGRSITALATRGAIVSRRSADSGAEELEYGRLERRLVVGRGVVSEELAVLAEIAEMAEDRWRIARASLSMSRLVISGAGWKVARSPTAGPQVNAPSAVA